MIQTTKERVLQFWSWFGAVRPELKQAISSGKYDLAGAFCGSKLKGLGLPFLCEAGGSGGNFALAMCPCGSKTEQFVCRYWRQLAPELENWNFFAFRQPRTPADCQKLRLGGTEIDASLFTFYCEANDERQKYDITVVSPIFSGRTDAEKHAFGMMLLYLFLGEALTEVYIGDLICRDTPPKNAGSSMSFSEFCAMLQSTPATRAWPWVNDPTALCFGYHPTTGSEEGLRGDIIGGFTRHVPLLGAPFDEADGLRAFGGVFCYFYYPAQQHDAAERSNLAARLEQLLETYRLGYSIGSAFGSEYNYLDMIIFDEPVFRAVFQDTEAVLGTPMFLDYFGGHGIQ